MTRDELTATTAAILKKNQRTTVLCEGLTIHARLGLPSFELILQRGEQQVVLRGSELALTSARQWGNAQNNIKLELLDCHNYPCAVHIAGMRLSQDEGFKLSEALGIAIRDISSDDPMEDIFLTEKRRLIDINNG